MTEMWYRNSYSVSSCIVIVSGVSNSTSTVSSCSVLLNKIACQKIDGESKIATTPVAKEKSV